MDRTGRNESGLGGYMHQQESPTIEDLLRDPPRPPDLRPEGQHIICGMCNSYPANFNAHSWRCPRVQQTVEAISDACEKWTPREEWKPDPPMYTLMLEKHRRRQMDKLVADPIPTGDFPVAPQSYVYFIKCGEFVKIGVSTRPNDRRASIATSTPHDIEIIGLMIGTPTDEKSLHRQFKHLRKNREWFILTDEIILEIRKRCGRSWKKLLRDA